LVKVSRTANPREIEEEPVADTVLDDVLYRR
jgi:hypothetical protein